MPMSGYSFVVPDNEATILSPPKNHFVIYKLALDAGLRFPLHDFIEQVLRFYSMSHNQLVPNVWHSILIFITV